MISKVIADTIRDKFPLTYDSEIIIVFVAACIGFGHLAAYIGIAVATFLIGTVT